MRYALIDNATLTGIQRLLGYIPVKNKHIIDNDILALENYIQALLFYDEIIAIDDYKPKYREDRRKQFPQIRFIGEDIITTEHYDKLCSQANTMTSNLEISAGKVNDTDFKKYFEDLMMPFQFTWDMVSSRHFLVPKMLQGNDNVLDKKSFNRLYASLFSEKFEQMIICPGLQVKPTKFYSGNGEEITFSEDYNLSKPLEIFASSLGWLSTRTCFYALAAQYLQADIFIQPIRQGFLKNIIRKIHPQICFGDYTQLINSANSKASNTLQNILQNSSGGFDVELPLFSAYFINKCGDSREIIKTVLNERDSKVFVSVRNKLRDLDSYAHDGTKIKEINLLTKDLELMFTNIQKEFYIGDDLGVSLKWFWGIGVSLFDKIPILKDLPIPDIQFIRLEPLKHLFKRKTGFTAAYRNILEDLIACERLGKYKDDLIKHINYDKADYYDIKVEEERFVRYSSWWKQPM